MDGMYGLHQASGEYSDRALMSPDNLIISSSSDFQSIMMNSTSFREHRVPPAPEQVMFGSDELISVASAITEAASISHEMRINDDDVSTSIKSKIASHPRYPNLLQAYIDCQKVGAPPEVSSLLDEIMRDYDKDEVASSFIGDNPELDDFMETYCDILIKYKSDLSRPFDEATAFLNKIESQLSSLCKGTFVTTASEG